MSRYLRDTALAWNRTAVGLMGFGFLAARFGLFLHVVRNREPVHGGLTLAIGVAFILLGTAQLPVSVRQYRRVAVALGAGRSRPAIGSRAAC